MLLLAAAAVAATAAPPAPLRLTATVQATATIRVIQAVVLKLDGSANAGAPPPREVVVRAADGSEQRVKVIEFQ
jgi:hypothetical protein